MHIAIIHDWLTVNGGAERVLAALHDLYPEAPIFTTIYNPSNFPELTNATIIPSLLDKIPGSRRHHQLFIPLMPLAVEHYDLRDFDIILSDSHACAKGAIKARGAKHICYCHTPMRYAWLPKIDPRANSSFLRRFAASRLRAWDLATVDRVDQYLANSHYIQNRIQQIYHRDSTVIYPPVDTNHWQPSGKVDNYFIYVGRLVAYKRPELVVQAFNKLGLPLKIIGTGPELANLRSLAQPNIEFLGRVDDKTLNELYSHTLALIFPTLEDFGLVPVEVMAAGRPVISINQGGAAETVIDGKTGLHFNEQTPEAIVAAVKQFQPEKFDTNTLRRHAEKFDTAVFQQNVKKIISQVTPQSQ